MRNKKRPKPAEKNHFLLILPVVASNPASGFIYGAGLSYAIKPSSIDKSISDINANATYSTKKLVNLNLKSNIFLKQGKLVFNGDWRYLRNTETTYGLGTRTGASANIQLNGFETEKDTRGQSLRFDHIRFHEIVSGKILDNFFAGIGFEYDNRFNIKDTTASDGDSSNAYHYQYSIQHGFNPKNYITSGICINLLFDSRDNNLNASQGYYANINYLINSTSFGSTKNSTLLLADLRAFLPLDKAKKNILAFWVYGNFVTSGNVPYLALPALGYDVRQRSGRGYTFGRFRGEDLLYEETEYRFPISRCSGILGGVVFVNATSTTDWKNNINLLGYIQPAYGTGLRIMLDKKTRTRLETDIGIGNHTLAFYFGVQETF